MFWMSQIELINEQGSSVMLLSQRSEPQAVHALQSLHVLEMVF